MDTTVYNLYPIIIIIHIYVLLYIIFEERREYIEFESVDSDCDVRNEFTYEEIIQNLSDSHKQELIYCLTCCLWLCY